MSAPAPTPESTKRIAGYEILSKLGQGGMGAVYKARQVSLDRTVALKVLPKQLTDKPEFINRFSREARVTGQLNHSNIIKVYDVGKSPTGICYYSMEFVEGESLRNILEREKRLSPPRTLKILEEMAAALDHAQKHGVIHRDIKPDNILIDKDGNVKLADLGLAKLSEDAAPSGGSFASMAGAVVGTPYYMSPEQAEGRTVDTRSDLYSLGATAYHLLTGAPPFTADTPIGVLTKHLTEPLPPLHTRLPAVPPSLEQVIHRLMEKDPANRYQTPAELQTALTQARATITTTRAARPAQAAPGGKGKLVAAVVAAGLVLVVVVALAARSKPGAQPPPQVPTPPPVASKDPQPERKAQEALNQANEWLTRHPEDLAGGRDLLEKITRQHPDTRAAREAGSQIKDLDALIGQQREAAALKARVEPLIAARRFSEARAELSSPHPSSESMDGVIRELDKSLREAQSARVDPSPRVDPPKPVETPAVPTPANDANLAEARKLMSDPRLDTAGLERVKQILGTPPADPQLASQYNRLYRTADARLALGRTGDLYRAHDWDGILKESDALRKEPDPLAALLDERDRNWLDRMERQARKNQRLGAWRCDFEHGEAKSWGTSNPWPYRKEDRPRTGKVQSLNNAQAKPAPWPERAIAGNSALKIGGDTLGDTGCSVETQSPLLRVHPGATLTLKARLCLWNPQHSRPRVVHGSRTDEAAYLCLCDDQFQLIPYDQARTPFVRKEGFLDGRAIGSPEAWGDSSPKVISFDRTLTLNQRVIDFHGKDILPLHVCAGISLEDAPGRSAVLILDSIEVYYPEEEP